VVVKNNFDPEREKLDLTGVSGYDMRPNP